MSRVSARVRQSEQHKQPGQAGVQASALHASPHLVERFQRQYVESEQRQPDIPAGGRGRLWRVLADIVLPTTFERYFQLGNDVRCDHTQSRVRLAVAGPSELSRLQLKFRRAAEQFGGGHPVALESETIQLQSVQLAEQEREQK